MAQKTIVHLVDDIDGTEATQTAHFGLDGRVYEIDLSNENYAKLTAALAEYVANARRANGKATATSTRTATASASADKEQNQAIREWARKRGMKVSERGRIAADVVAKFHNQNADATVAVEESAPTSPYTPAIPAEAGVVRPTFAGAAAPAYA